MALAMLIAFVDQNGISTALPAMAADLEARASISWAGTASLLANTTFQMLYGRLSDVGRKTVFVAAVILLALADLFCGLSPSSAALYVFRALAGIGGGGITNLAMIIVSDVVSLERRGKYQGIIGSMVGLGSVTGPFLAAAFVSHASWRLFWTLAPLGALNGLLAYLYLPSKEPTVSAAESVRQIDWIGLLTSSVGTIFLLIPISEGGSYFPWKALLVVGMLVIGSLSLALFVLVEWKLANLPMMPAFLLGAAYQSSVYYVPLYLQNAHRFSITASALVSVPMMAQSVASTLSGLWISRYKRYGVVIRLGFALWTLGAGLSLLFHRHTHPAIIILVLAIIQARLRAELPSNHYYLTNSAFALPDMDPATMPAPVLDAYMAASRAVFVVQVPLVGLCLLGTSWIKDRGLSPKDDESAAAEESLDMSEGDILRRAKK